MAAAAAKVTIEGRIERFLSGPTADGFAILKLKQPNGQFITVKGRSIFGGYVNGDQIKVEGRKVRHPKFGDQLDATDAQPAGKVDEVAGMMRWIAQAGIQGVGEATAAKLCAKAGTRTIDAIIAREPDMVAILKNKMEAVREALMPRYGEAKFGSILAAHDIGRTTRIKIYEEFGERTLRVLHENPYELIHAVDGIAFATADQIARKAGVANDSADRLIAAAHDSLRRRENNGDSWASIDQLIIDAVAATGVRREMVEQAITDAECPNVVAMYGYDENTRSYVPGWAIARLNVRENELAEMILNKASDLSAMGEEEAADLVRQASAKLKITLNGEQHDAAIMALIEPFAVITGYPGTGKTTVLDVIVTALKMWRRKIDIELTSPTGKAAQRMREKTRHPARTIHRMLGANGRRFLKTAENPLNADYIAIDEATMLDIDLAHATMAACGHARILLLGDVDQLPSVGAGRVFGDIIDSGTVPVVRLTEIRRQGKGSGIALGAAAVRRGELPEWTDDLKFIEINDNAKAAEEAERRHNARAKEDADVQVLTPGHQSDVGTISLNRRLSESSGLTGPEVRIAGGAPARVGSKVMQRENNDSLDVYNGDVGRISGLSRVGEKQGINVAIAGGETRKVAYSSSEMGELELAYAVTVHKSQGSEYDEVIITLSSSHWMLLTRTLLNTAMTRAAKTCTIIGSKRALMRAIQNNDAAHRRTQLCQTLRSLDDADKMDVAV